METMKPTVRTARCDTKMSGTLSTDSGREGRIRVGMFARKNTPKLLSVIAVLAAIIILLSAPCIALAAASDNTPLSWQALLTMPLGIGFVLLVIILTIRGSGSLNNGRRKREFHGQFTSARAARTAAELRMDFKNRLPKVVQPFVTWLMGYPYPGQKPLIPVKHWALTVLYFLVIWASGIASAFWAISTGGFTLFVLPLSLLLTVCGARALQVHICHQGIHGNLSGKWKFKRKRDNKEISLLDLILVEIISTLIVVQNFDGYEHDHDGIHHPQLATKDDPDFKFIVGVMNLKPWLSYAENRKQFYRALRSPKIHGLFLLSRLQANYWTKETPLYRRLMSFCWLLIIELMFGTAVVLSGMWLEFICFAAFCAFAMTVPYHMAAMAQFFTEHFWTEKRKPGQSAKQHLLNLLVNRHLCDPLPVERPLTFRWAVASTRFWARMFVVHLPIRLAVLQADLVVHGGHHLWPLHKGWTDSIYTFRRLAEESGCNLREIVGSFGQILDEMLEAFSNSCPPPTKDTQTITTAEAMKIVAGM